MNDCNRTPVMSKLPRRDFMIRSAAALATAGLGASAAAAATGNMPPLLRAPRLKPGDTVALINPSSAIFEREPYAVSIESLQALGFKVREAPHLRSRWGHFAGTDAERSADVNAMFADPTVNGILAMGGGSGGTRMLPLIDYDLIKRSPKFFGGFSDLTALINAIQVRTGLVTFHAPMGASSAWTPFSVRCFQEAVMQGTASTLRNEASRGDALVTTEGRFQTIRGGRAQGRIVGGNLTVLTAMAGSAYFPNVDGAILCLEDVNEYLYRVDRMLSTLRLIGALDRVAGVVLGSFSKCEPGDGYGEATLDEIFDDYFKPLKVPVYSGAMFGHVKQQFTLPIGLPAEIDADAGTLRFLSPAVV
jgi:muramoyltetrapeptide carboxypeptidase